MKIQDLKLKVRRELILTGNMKLIFTWVFYNEIEKLIEQVATDKEFYLF